MLPECVSEGNESESGAQRGGGEREGKEEGKRKGRKRGRERRRLRVEAASGMRMRGAPSGGSFQSSDSVQAVNSEGVREGVGRRGCNQDSLFRIDRPDPSARPLRVSEHPSRTSIYRAGSSILSGARSLHH
ncbi:Rab effector MyRIP [Sarotherodon galilaeus]